jgi:hypothetical protein
VTPNDIALFENELQQAAQQFQWQVGASDWVNGSTFGIITNNTRFGYGYSITNYNGLVYIYYTELTPSGVAVIRGLVFNGTTAMRAPLPTFNDLGEASPLLVRLDNGSLMMIWAGVPLGNYNLNNLTILLQASVLHNNTWGPVVDLTKSGDAMSYASDGEYIYLVYEPKLSLTYNNTVLEELTPTGVVVRVLSIPGIVGITGVSDGLVVVQFINGTYALVNMNTGAVEPLNASIAGFSDSLLYYFYNGTLTVVNGTQRLVISLPIYANAFPMAWSHGLVIIAWRPGLLSVFIWNGTALQSIRNYTTAFTIVPGASIIDDVLYLAWLEQGNITNGDGSIYMAIIPLKPSALPTPITTTVTLPPPSPLYIRVVAPSFASWTIYANASTGWYAVYDGSGSASFGPAFPGWPGTSVSLNVSSVGNCPSPSITYEPSNEVTLSNGANYVTVLISCEPMVGVGLNMSYGGGLIMIINKPGLPMSSLMLNGPVSRSLTLPVNTTITFIIWPYNGYTLAGLNVNNNTMNYIGTPWGSYIATITITNQTTITITYKQG